MQIFYSYYIPKLLCSECGVDCSITMVHGSDTMFQVVCIDPSCKEYYKPYELYLEKKTVFLKDLHK